MSLRGKRSSLRSREIGGARLSSFEMELSSFSFDLSKLSVSSCRGLGRGLKLGELSPLLLGVRSLHSSQD